MISRYRSRKRRAENHGIRSSRESDSDFPSYEKGRPSYSSESEERTQEDHRSVSQTQGPRVQEELSINEQWKGFGAAEKKLPSKAVHEVDSDEEFDKGGGLATTKEITPTGLDGRPTERNIDTASGKLQGKSTEAHPGNVVQLDYPASHTAGEERAKYTLPAFALPHNSRTSFTAKGWFGNKLSADTGDIGLAS